MIEAQLACGHWVTRNPPGLRVPPQYRCWQCKSDEVVLRWYELPQALQETLIARRYANRRRKEAEKHGGTAPHPAA